MTLDPIETASPTGGPAAAAGETANTGADHQLDQGNPGEGGESGEGEGAGDGKEATPAGKPEKTEEQRELARLRRRVDNLTRQKYERQAAPAPQQQTSQPDDDEPVTLTRAELNRQIEERAQTLAPSMKDQHAEVERRQGVVQSLAKDWGTEKFNTLSAELDDAFSGLVDRSGAPKPATDAIFEADNPKAVIEFLTDPDNADEAERISKMTAGQAGRAIAKLESKLEAEKSNAKPKPSNAAAPLEPPRGGGGPKGMPDPANTKAYMAWANAQDRA